MNDMSAVIVPKSDQISADDLLSGPRTICISDVAIRPGTEQPVTIRYEGDEGRPFKPCKSMCRVMVALWGPDAKQYVGKSLTLYRDPSVKWGGMEVGGIRISDASHIDRPLTMALTQTKGSKKLVTVKVLKVEAPKPVADKVADGVAALIRKISGCYDHDALKQVTGAAAHQRTWLAENRPELAKRVDDAVTAALAAIDPAPEAEGA